MTLFQTASAVAIDESRFVLHAGGMGNLFEQFSTMVTPAEYIRSLYISSFMQSVVK